MVLFVIDEHDLFLPQELHRLCHILYKRKTFHVKFSLALLDIFYFLLQGHLNANRVISLANDDLLYVLETLRSFSLIIQNTFINITIEFLECLIEHVAEVFLQLIHHFCVLIIQLLLDINLYYSIWLFFVIFFKVFLMPLFIILNGAFNEVFLARCKLVRINLESLYYSKTLFLKSRISNICKDSFTILFAH